MAKKSLLWVDLEMTGLDEKTDQILEFAGVVTNYELEIIDQKHFIIYQPQIVLDQMNDWCKEHHGKSGLTQLVPKGTPLGEVEKQLCAWIDQHFGKKQGKEGAVLAGNSIHNDRRFIDAYLPEVSRRLHYRMVDVSSFKEIFRERFGIKVEKNTPHRAIDDIQASIDELKKYLSYFRVTEVPE